MGLFGRTKQPEVEPEPEAKPKTDRRELAYITVTRDFFQKRLTMKDLELLKEKHRDVYSYINCTIQSQVIAPALVIQLESRRAALVAWKHVMKREDKEGVDRVLEILDKQYFENASLDDTEEINHTIKSMEASIREADERSRQFYEYRRLIQYSIQNGKIVSEHRKEIKAMAGQSFSFLRNPQDRKKRKKEARYMTGIDHSLYDEKGTPMNLDVKDYKKVWEAQVKIYGPECPLSSTQKANLLPTVAAWANRSFINMSIELADMVIRIHKLNKEAEEHERISKSGLEELNKALGFSTVEEAEKYIEKRSKDAKELRASCKNFGTKKHLEWKFLPEDGTK